MDNRRLLDDVYKDFFGDKVLTNINQKEEQKVDINVVDNILLEDDSKELLKKIITYINSYKDGVYINFNMLLYKLRYKYYLLLKGGTNEKKKYCYYFWWKII